MNKTNTFAYLMAAGLLRGTVNNPVGMAGLFPPAGNIFFVNSGSANAVDSNGSEDYGKSWDNPFSTLDYAIGRCTANHGDIIYVAPQHAETLTAAAAINLDVAGITVVGIGEGFRRPTITFGAAAATVAFAAANVMLSNFVFNITGYDVTVMIDINSTGCRLDNCFIEMHADETADKEAVTGIDITGAAANACDNTVISNCAIHAYKGTAAGSTNGIELGEVADRVLVENCEIIGDFTNAGIHNPTGKVLTNLVVKKCYIENKQTGDHAVELVSACTGFLIENYYAGDTDAALVDPGSCMSFECYGNDTVDKNGMLLPVAVTAT